MSATAPLSYDVVIAGGGIVGAACALAFAQARFRVALVEREFLGSGATAAGMGHVVVMDDSEAQFALTRRSQQLWQALSATLPAGAEFEALGTLWVAADEEDWLRPHACTTISATAEFRAECSPAKNWRRWNRICALGWRADCS